jgi:hypothetical protein
MTNCQVRDPLCDLARSLYVASRREGVKKGFFCGKK